MKDLQTDVEFEFKDVSLMFVAILLVISAIFLSNRGIAILLVKRRYKLFQKVILRSIVLQ